MHGLLLLQGWDGGQRIGLGDAAAGVVAGVVACPSHWGISITAVAIEVNPKAVIRAIIIAVSAIIRCPVWIVFSFFPPLDNPVALCLSQACPLPESPW